MNDQVQYRKQLSKTDFAYTRWYQLPKGHTLHVVWCNNDYVMINLTKLDFQNNEWLIDQQKLRYDSIDLENHIKVLNKYIRKILTS